MNKENVTNKDNFDALLLWLDHNRDSAGQKYEKIRIRLINIFNRRGCFEAEELADETISRVTVKILEIAENYTGEPALYFYGVAKNIYLEWVKKQKKVNHQELVETDNHKLIYQEGEDAEREAEYQCLDLCLSTLAENQRTIIIEYYQGEKREKIESRKRLGQHLGITNAALQIRASRIRDTLRNCIKNCVAKKNV